MGNWLKTYKTGICLVRYWEYQFQYGQQKTKEEQICIGSAAPSKTGMRKVGKSWANGKNPFADFDPKDMSDENYHTLIFTDHFVDDIIF